MLKQKEITSANHLYALIIIQIGFPDRTRGKDPYRKLEIILIFRSIHNVINEPRVLVEIRLKETVEVAELILGTAIVYFVLV